MPVVVENDVNAAALGAVALSGKEDLVYLSIGTGLAAGLVLGVACAAATTAPPARSGTSPSTRPARPASAGSAAASRPSRRAGPGRGLAVRRRAARAGRCSRPRPPATRRRSRSATGSRPASPTPCARSAWPSTRRPWSSAAASRTWASRCGSRSPTALLDQAAASPFLASLDLAGRLRVVPSDYPVAAVGAALLGRTAGPA